MNSANIRAIMAANEIAIKNGDVFDGRVFTHQTERFSTFYTNFCELVYNIELHLGDLTRYLGEEVRNNLDDFFEIAQDFMKSEVDLNEVGLTSWFFMMLDTGRLLAEANKLSQESYNKYGFCGGYGEPDCADLFAEAVSDLISLIFDFFGVEDMEGLWKLSSEMDNFLYWNPGDADSKAFIFQ